MMRSRCLFSLRGRLTIAHWSPSPPRKPVRKRELLPTTRCCGFFLSNPNEENASARRRQHVADLPTRPGGKFIKKLLRITGISATPSQQKALGEKLEAGGQIWIANLKTGAVRKLSEEK